MRVRTWATEFAGKPPLEGVLANRGLVRGDIDAVDFIVGDETLQPLDLGTDRRKIEHPRLKLQSETL